MGSFPAGASCKSPLAIFLDRDGTLILDRNYLSDPAGVELIPGVAEVLRDALRAGCLLFLFSNQSGVGRGYFTLDQVHAVNRRMEELLNLPPPGFSGIGLAPEAPWKPVVYRKPSPRFILEMIEQHGLDPQRCLMIGDGECDALAGLNAGINAALVATGKDGPPVDSEVVRSGKVRVFPGLDAAFQWFLRVSQSGKVQNNLALLHGKEEVFGVNCNERLPFSHSFIMEALNTAGVLTGFDHGAEDHAPDLYAHDAIAEKVDGLEGITDEHLDFYRQEGYLAVENAFSPEEVKSALDGLIHLIMGGNPDFKGISFEAKAREILPQLGPAERQDAVRKLMYFVDHDERLKAVSHAPKLVSVIERILGGEKATMFQDMALLKPPRMGREKPWHQDHAYFDFPLGTKVVGVWIALDEATLENGCMRVQPGKHRDGPVIHFKRRDWQICDTEIMGKRCVAAPLKPGGLLLFDGLLPHGTPTNYSPSRRRALQFHYSPVGVQKCSTEERLGHFGSEGKDVSC